MKKKFIVDGNIEMLLKLLILKLTGNAYVASRIWGQNFRTFICKISNGI